MEGAFQTVPETWRGAGVFNDKIDPEAMANLLISQIEGAILLSKVHNSLDIFESSCSEIRKLVIKKEYWEDFRYDN